MEIFDDEGNILGSKSWDFEMVEYSYYCFDKIAHETEKAWLIEIGWKQAWFPKEYCWHDDNVMTVPTWLNVNFKDI